MALTINQALDKLTNKQDLNLAQQDLKDNLLKLKLKEGGKTRIENCEEVDNIITHGNKEGKEED